MTEPRDVYESKLPVDARDHLLVAGVVLSWAGGLAGGLMALLFFWQSYFDAVSVSGLVVAVMAIGSTKLAARSRQFALIALVVATLIAGGNFAYSYALPPGFGTLATVALALLLGGSACVGASGVVSGVLQAGTRE